MIRVDQQIDERLFERIRSRRLPFQGTFELTRRCNLRCSYCYVGFDWKISPEEELSREEIYSLLDQVAAAGCLFLTFTGGEPLLRKDFSSIYSYAVKKGFKVVIFTNGTLINRSVIDTFLEYPPFYLEITMPGISEETYERVTGVKGSYERFRKALELLREYSIPFRLKSVIGTFNYRELPEMRRFAQSLPVEYRFDTHICPRLNGDREPLRYRLSPEDVVRLDREDEARWEDWSDFACRQDGKGGTGLLYQCGGGLYSFHISSTGQLGICVLDTNYSYDLRRGDFKTGWEKFLAGVRRIKMKTKTKCRDCELQAICGNCPAHAKLETGSPEKPVEFLCQVARLRVKLLNNSSS